MSAFVRGEPVNLPAEFWVIDPITKIPTLTDPNTVTFAVLAPDGTETEYVFGVDGNVTNPSVGVFVCALAPQLPTGVYHFNVVGTGAAAVQAPDGEFTVYESALDVPDPPPRAVVGPCSQWISGQDVASCARVDYGQSAYVFDTVAYNASLALYEVSDRRFPGICARTVRPCRDECGCWLSGPVSYGFGPFFSGSGTGFGGWGWYNERGDKFGCAPMSKVKLGGYPVSRILSVKLDGVALPELDPATGKPNWRLDKWRYLVRMDDPSVVPAQPRFWPSCQNMSLDDGEKGTFSVEYEWGSEVPQLGRDAAVEVANQLFLACGGQECVLPAGATRVVRQGIEVERGLLANWFDDKKPTGLVNLDLFLAAYAHGKQAGRKSAFWSPDTQQFARRVGVNR